MTGEKAQRIFIPAMRLPSGSEQHVVNVRVRDSDTEHEFAMEPEDVLNLGELLSKFIWDDRKSIWQVGLSPEEFKMLVNKDKT